MCLFRRNHNYHDHNTEILFFSFTFTLRLEYRVCSVHPFLEKNFIPTVRPSMASPLSSVLSYGSCWTATLARLWEQRNQTKRN